MVSVVITSLLLQNVIHRGLNDGLFVSRYCHMGVDYELGLSDFSKWRLQRKNIPFTVSVIQDTCAAFLTIHDVVCFTWSVILLICSSQHIIHHLKQLHPNLFPFQC